MHTCSYCSYSAVPFCMPRKSPHAEKGVKDTKGTAEIRTVFYRIAICFRALCCYPLNSIVGMGPYVSRSVSKMHVKFERTRSKKKDKRIEVTPITSETLTENGSHKYSKVFYKIFKGNARNERNFSSDKASPNDGVSIRSSDNWDQDSTETLKAKRRVTNRIKKLRKKRKNDAKKEFMSAVMPDVMNKDGFSPKHSMYWDEVVADELKNNVTVCPKSSKRIQKDLFSPKMSMSEFVKIFRINPPVDKKTEEAGMVTNSAASQNEVTAAISSRIMRKKESSKFRTRFPFFKVKKFSEIFTAGNTDGNKMVPEEIVINYSNRSGKRQCLVLPLTKAVSGDGPENLIKSKSFTVVPNKIFEIKSCNSLDTYPMWKQ